MLSFERKPKHTLRTSLALQGVVNAGVQILVPAAPPGPLRLGARFPGRCGAASAGFVS